MDSDSSAKCAVCGTVMDFGSAVCKNCGNPVTSQAPRVSQSARGAAPDYGGSDLVAFASGLPAWSIEPPAVVVRRKSRR